jgi:hypothetical protein
MEAILPAHLLTEQYGYPPPELKNLQLSDYEQSLPRKTGLSDCFTDFLLSLAVTIAQRSVNVLEPALRAARTDCLTDPGG